MQSANGDSNHKQLQLNHSETAEVRWYWEQYLEMTKSCSVGRLWKHRNTGNKAYVENTEILGFRTLPIVRIFPK
jgi:hypothetical protein